MMSEEANNPETIIGHRAGTEVINSENLGIDHNLDLAMLKLLEFLDNNHTAKLNCVHKILHSWNTFLNKEEYVAQLNGNCIIINNDPPRFDSKRETHTKTVRLGKTLTRELVYEKIAEYYMEIHGAVSEHPSTWNTALKRMVAWDAMGEMLRFLPHAKLSVSNMTADALTVQVYFDDDSEIDFQATHRSIHVAKHLVAVQVLKHEKFNLPYCGNKRRTFKQIISETTPSQTEINENPKKYQQELTKLLRHNGILNKQNQNSHFTFNESENMAEVLFHQRAKAKNIEDSAKGVYSQICGWTLVHADGGGRLTDPVAIAERRAIKNIEMEKKMFIAKNFMAMNQANQANKYATDKFLPAKQNSVIQRKVAEPLLKRDVEPGFEDGDNWAMIDGDESGELEEDNSENKKIPENSPGNKNPTQIIHSSKQKMWLKFINMALDPKKNVNDSMLASYFGQSLGLPLLYIDNEWTSDGVHPQFEKGFQFEARISDVLCATGEVQPRKKPAKAEAASALVKLILERHENEATRFIF